MKQTFFIAASILFFGFNLQAQDKDRPQPSCKDFHQRVEKITKELSLTAEQEKKITALYEKKAQEMEAEREKNKIEREEHRKKVKAQNEAFDAELKKILTEEQYTKLQSERTNRKKDGKKIVKNKIKK